MRFGSGLFHGCRVVPPVLLALGACQLGPSTPPDLPGATRPVTLLVEPDAGSGAVLELIASARVSVWMEMYLLTSGGAIDALAERARAGCDVRVTLEPSPYADEGANQDAYDQLGRAGVRVGWSTPRFSFTHAKAFTVDHARLAVMTLNLTGAGLSGNREFAVMDDDPGDVAAAEVVFAGDAAGATVGGAGRVVTSPGGSRSTLLSLIEEAQRTLFVETEELTDPGILRALLAARMRGVSITLAWPDPATDAGAAFAALAAAGATVRAVAAPAIHAKAMVADGRTAYVGSANLTPTSLDRNREIGLWLADPAAADRLAAVIADDAARGIPP